MIGLFLFPVEPTEKGYPFKRSPKKVLKVTEEEMAEAFRNITQRKYIMYYLDDMDKMKEDDILDIVAEKYGKGFDIEHEKIKGTKWHMSADGKWYARLIVGPRKWFSSNIDRRAVYD